MSVNGFVYVMDRGRIQQFSANGDYLSQWHVSGSLSAFDISSTGDLYIAQWDSIAQYSADGLKLSQWGSHGQGVGQFDGILGLAIGPDGSIFVSDNGNCRVQVFDAAGAFVREWGECGSGQDGTFTSPSGITVDANENVYVGDINLPWIQRFSETGIFLGKYSLPGSPFVQDVAVDYNGNVYVVDESQALIHVLDSSGSWLFAWGGPGTGPGQFDSPLAVALHSGAGIYVVDSGNSRIQKFTYPVSTTKVSWGSLKNRYSR